MRRIPLLAVLVFLAPHVFAQADVGVRIKRNESGPAFQGQPYTFTLTVQNRGPAVAHDVSVLWWFNEPDAMPPVPDPRCVAERDDAFRCTFPGIFSEQAIRITTGPMVNTFASAAEVTATESDPDTSDNFYSLIVQPIRILSDLGLNITMPSAIQPDGTATIRYSIQDQSKWEADVQAKIALTHATEIVSSNAPCVRSSEPDAFALCTLPALAPGQKFDLDLTVRFPTPDGRIETSLTPIWTAIDTPGATIRASSVYPRTFRVTTTGDAGAGSLRQAILDANEQCPVVSLPCTIAIELPAPVPERGWFAIHVAAPLPAITTGNLTIDGLRQTALTGDTNPFGPEVHLDGSALADGNGFFVRAPGCTILGFGIGGFPDNGVFLLRADGTTLPAAVAVRYSSIGVDPSGVAAPNGRGIMLPHGGASIEFNIIAANRRSGIYVWNGDYSIHANQIARNGASGIYFGPYANGTATQNDIQQNRDFGIGLAPAAFTRVAIAGNLIRDNGHGGIDIGLDGPTLDGPGPVPPTITAAYYDGRDTYILGTAPPPVLDQISTRYTVELYANRTLDEHGLAEGERPISGEMTLDESGQFALVIAETDLRGWFINGIGTLHTTLYGEFTYRQSSELGRVKKVE